VGAASFAQRCRRALSAIERSLAAHFSRNARANAENALRIEEKLTLGTKKMLYLVSCREKEFLIAAGADTIVSVVEVSPVMPLRAGASKASVSRIQKREGLS
jgi:Flagellar biosynthesis protein, FliO